MALRDAQDAIKLWGIEPEQIVLAAHRENEVYRLTAGGLSHALRLHRPGYRDVTELRSELAMMDALSAAGVHVPQPIKSLRGAFIEAAGAQFFSLLSWVGGEPLMKASAAMTVAHKQNVFRRLGRSAARMHDILDSWQPPPGFSRVRWDLDGLLGDAPHWGQFWNCETLSGADQQLILSVRARLQRDIEAVMPEFGLIHADLVGENILVDGSSLCIIDFDDSGFGFRLQDLATALIKFVDDPHFDMLERPLLEGYREQREIDSGVLDAFVMVRALSSLGWSWPRRHDPGGLERHERARRLALRLAEHYARDRSLKQK
jgi:Ser/Thr protein kinase RdoA (MazF antagonist)